MKTPLLRSPYRLLANLVALGLVLAALAFSPAPPSVDASKASCELGCISWTASCGCNAMSYCCSNSETYWCSYSSSGCV